MTSSKPSDPNKPRLVVAGETADAAATARTTYTPAEIPDGLCPQCEQPMRLRNARPFPVAIQAAFGVSFAAFLWYQGSDSANSKILWAWSAIQIALGILLVRARYASAKKVFICLRCASTLR